MPENQDNMKPLDGDDVFTVEGIERYLGIIAQEEQRFSHPNTFREKYKWEDLTPSEKELVRKLKKHPLKREPGETEDQMRRRVAKAITKDAGLKWTEPPPPSIPDE